MDDGVYKAFNSSTGNDDQEQNNQVFPPLST